MKSFKENLNTHSSGIIRLEEIKKELERDEREMKRNPTKYSEDPVLISMYENYMKKTKKSIDKNMNFHFDSLYEMNKKL